MSGRGSAVAAVCIAGTFVLAGLIGIRHAHRWGAGVVSDSVQYLAAAVSLRDGRGLEVPYSQNGVVASGPVSMVHYPPLFSAAIAAVAKLSGAPILRSAEIVLLVSYAVACALLLALLMRLGVAPVTAALATGVFAWHGQTLNVGTLVMSELPFLAVLPLAVGALEMWREDRNRWALRASAVLFVLAYEVRYAGIGLLAAALLFIVIERARWQEPLEFAALAALGVATFRLAGSASTGRSLGFHPQPWRRIAGDLIDALQEWVPLPGGKLVILAAAIALGMILFRAWKEPVVRMCVVLTAMYVAFLIVNLTFGDTTSVIDGRLLLPAFWLLIIAACIAAPRHWLAAVCALIVALAQGRQAWPDLASAGRTGQWYSSVRWRTAPVIAALRSIPPDVRIYTNGPDVVYAYTGRLASWTPIRFDRYSYEPDPSMLRRLDGLRASVTSGTAVVVWFDWIDFRPGLLPLDRIEQGIVERSIAASRRAVDGGVILSASPRYAVPSVGVLYDDSR